MQSRVAARAAAQATSTVRQPALLALPDLAPAAGVARPGRKISSLFWPRPRPIHFQSLWGGESPSALGGSTFALLQLVGRGGNQLTQLRTSRHRTPATNSQGAPLRIDYVD